MSAKKKNEKRVNFGTVLLWIFFLPIMATIAIAKTDKWKTVTKVISIALVWIITLTCAGTYTETEDNTLKIKKIQYITPSTYTVEVDQEINFSAYIQPENITKELLKITISDKSALEVDFKINNDDEKTRIDLTIKALKVGSYTILLSNLDETIKSNKVTIQVKEVSKAEPEPSEPTEPNQPTQPNEPSQPTNPNERIVYDTLTGSKYHYSKNCRYLKNAIQIIEKTLQEALNAGKSACSSCVK
jgi:hypothetical protein